MAQRSHHAPITAGLVRRPRALAVIALLVAVACSPTQADHYARGVAAADAQQWVTARAEFEAAGPYKDAHQRSLDALLAEADQLEKSGDLDHAVPLLQQAGTYKDADQHAKQLEGTLTVLAILYEQMTAAAQTNDWEKALGLSGQIIEAVPGFRDVKARRDTYLDTVYSQASASIGQKDWPHAFVLLTLLVKAEPGYKDAQAKLTMVQAARRAPLPGVYSFDESIDDGLWFGELRTIAVGPDGRLTVNVHWTNDHTVSRLATCLQRRANAEAVLILADGTRSPATDASCSALPDQPVPPDGTFDESATFPPIADGTKPFGIDWYGLKVAGSFVLSH